jgi:hypothetical protein
MGYCLDGEGSIRKRLERKSPSSIAFLTAAFTFG